MKFSHGVWTMREGVTALYPLRVHEQRQADGELQLICVNRPAEQMLNNYALVVGLSSPLPGTIRIRVRHLLGQKARPRGFDLDYGLVNIDARIDDQGSKLCYSSGDLSLEIDKERFSFELRRGSEMLTSSRHNQLGLMTLPGGEQH